MAAKDSYLVIGGCGFLGRHIVEQLLARGERAVAVFDLVQRHNDKNVQFFTGDICNLDDLGTALKKVFYTILFFDSGLKLYQTHTTCIIHTASPMHGAKPEVFWKVNVEGTRTVIAAAVANGVSKLVFTSTAGVTFSGHEDMIDIDERLPYVTEETAHDTYNYTKALAEKSVIEANGKEGLRTVAIRPAGIFG
jgi:sterol-4alpha-carboxylate 3-dehydrogenase (decarboxylating)